MSVTARDGIGGPSLNEGTNSIRAPFLPLVFQSNHVVCEDLRAPWIISIIHEAGTRSLFTLPQLSACAGWAAVAPASAASVASSDRDRNLQTPRGSLPYAGCATATTSPAYSTGYSSPPQRQCERSSHITSRPGDVQPLQTADRGSVRWAHLSTTKTARLLQAVLLPEVYVVMGAVWVWYRGHQPESIGCLCERGCAPRCQRRDHCRGNIRSGFGCAAQPLCAGQRRTSTP